MQLFALRAREGITSRALSQTSSTPPLISALAADSGKNYFCPECLGRVRVKKGQARVSHFFHLHPNSTCKQSGKGVIHLKIQQFLHAALPGSIMEYPFPKIGRIADLFDPATRRIIEIQYSPMSLEEAKSRCYDYESLGYWMVWILHDTTFNQARQKNTERFLRTKTCYYCNMSANGAGGIYDQLDSFQKNNRKKIHALSNVSLTQCQPLPSRRWPTALQTRANTWSLTHAGDFLDRELQGIFQQPVNNNQTFYAHVKNFYQTLFYLLLERMNTSR